MDTWLIVSNAVVIRHNSELAYLLVIIHTAYREQKQTKCVVLQTPGVAVVVLGAAFPLIVNRNPVVLLALLYSLVSSGPPHECIHMAWSEPDKRYSLDIETARVAVVGDSTSALLSDALKKMDRLIGRSVAGSISLEVVLMRCSA